MKPSRLARALSFRPLAFVGAFSYSLYLIHVPLLALFWQEAVHPLRLHGAASLALLVTVATPLILTVSYGFFLICERPFMSTSQRRAAKGEFTDTSTAGPPPIAAPEPATV